MTTQSYDEGFKGVGDFTKNLQICFQYFNEAYDPINRILTVNDSLRQLLTPATREILEMKK